MHVETTSKFRQNYRIDFVSINTSFSFICESDSISGSVSCLWAVLLGRVKTKSTTWPKSNCKFSSVSSSLIVSVTWFGLLSPDLRLELEVCDEPKRDRMIVLLMYVPIRLNDFRFGVIERKSLVIMPP